MPEEKKILDKLYTLADCFNTYIKNKCYSEAVSCYKKARDKAVACRFGEERMHMLFGERGERGVILRQGMFREDLVQKAYYEEYVKKKDPIEEKQKNSA